MKNLILNFFLLLLRILLNFSPDASYKRSGFSKTLLKKGLKFIPSRKSSTITFNLSFVLLSVEIDLIAKIQSCKRHTFRAYGNNRIKIIFVLPIKVITLYIQAFIVQVEVTSLENSIPEDKICLAILLTLNK